ncbi:hypothetical protein NK213_14720 [Sebaldella sp. S0638]|nr:hypothetical protein [Sebaldella sp. S0638]
MDEERPILTAEYILYENPDFLLIGMGATSAENFILENPQLAGIKALRNKNIIKTDSCSLMRGSPGIIDEMSKLYSEMKKLINSSIFR